MNEAVPIFFFLSVGSVALFSFLAVATWADARQKERKAFYEAEALKKIAETQGSGSNSALEFLREQEKFARARRQEGMKLGGLINLAIGVALVIFLGAVTHGKPAFLVGLVPAFVGVALLVYTFVFVPKN
jgi:Flp pilus assembly protein TadB